MYENSSIIVDFNRAIGHDILDFYARELVTLGGRADKIMAIIAECLPGPIIADKT